MRVYLGIDDTDSHSGGCTTYVGYLLAREVLRKWGPGAFADFPRLVRLNPNVPFKTRGNAAVSLALNVPEGDVEELWKLAIDFVENNARREGKTDPGVAMAVGEIPWKARLLYKIALTQVVSKSAAQRAGLLIWGGRGIIGAVAAVGADLTKSTFELLAYRGGERRPIPPSLVKLIEAFTFPFTFHNLDGRRVLIEPKGPDPVYYGIRGITPQHLLYAKSILESHGYRPAGWVIYRTNQAVDAHIEDGVFFNEPTPYSYYKIRGVVIEAKRIRGRHVVGRLDNGLVFVAYRHLGKLATELEKCVMCDVVLYGGLKPRAGGLYLYVERAHVLGRYVRVKTRCPYCGGSLESTGRGWRCRKCGTRFRHIQIKWLYDHSARRTLLPRPGEWRHLLKPPGLDAAIAGFFSPHDVEWIG
ncbi:tRNA(Ile)(2)-agmatinylcytidine synthase [Pyrobaculum aerophilum]|uniref:tRNA(Ile)(2)-agmatinylcytidine synthase n=1 Tax=Pyrobaculum aerophilum TaxID=13773 RepID=UPI002FDAF5F2